MFIQLGCSACDHKIVLEAKQEKINDVRVGPLCKLEKDLLLCIVQGAASAIVTRQASTYAEISESSDNCTNCHVPEATMTKIDQLFGSTLDPEHL